MSGGATAFTSSGKVAGLYRGLRVAVSAGAFADTGNAAQLLAGRRTTAGAGAVALTGKTSILVYTPLNAYVLPAFGGAVSVSRRDAQLLYNRIFTTAKGSFAVSGITAQLLRGFTLPAAVSQYVLSGKPVTFAYTQAYRLTGEFGTYTLTAEQADLLVSRILAASASGFAVSGQIATLSQATALPVALADPQWQIAIQAPDIDALIKHAGHDVSIASLRQTTAVKSANSHVIIH
jgi:hypothetical protein